MSLDGCVVDHPFAFVVCYCFVFVCCYRSRIMYSAYVKAMKDPFTHCR